MINFSYALVVMVLETITKTNTQKRLCNLTQFVSNQKYVTYLI